jgi:P27 family predicted phage terminase small subunit
MARYRKPDTAKKVAGTFRPDRAKRRPKTKGLAVVPVPPGHLTDSARAEWLKLAPLVTEQRTLAPADLRGFEMLCETLATVTQAQTVIATDGLTIGKEGGTVRAHPAVKIMEAARGQATRLLIEYGLTPRARGHVEPASEATPNNPFAEIG